MALDTPACSRFRAVLETAEDALDARDWEALDGLVAELSSMAEVLDLHPALRARWEALFAASDPELR